MCAFTFPIDALTAVATVIRADLLAAILASPAGFAKALAFDAVAVVVAIVEAARENTAVLARVEVVTEALSVYAFAVGRAAVFAVLF